MKRYFCVLNLVDPPDRFRITKKLEVECNDWSDGFEKAQRYVKNNNIKGSLFSVTDKNDPILNDPELNC